jgi:hypothetical protein
MSDDHDDLRQPPVGWSDRFLGAVRKLAAARLDEFTVPPDPAEAKAWGAVLAILNALTAEQEARAALYGQVEDALATWRTCPTCGAVREGGDDAG